MKMRLALLAAMVVLVAAFPTVSPAASRKNPVTQCMVDDGYGRFRPCSALYKRENPNWRAGDQCMTDDGYGRYRPCDAGYKAKHGGGAFHYKNGGGETKTVITERPRILDTGYTALPELGKEKAGYGLYSYVILSSDSERSSAFLEQVFKSIPAVEDAAPDIKPAQLNVLYIPGKPIMGSASADPAKSGKEYAASLYDYAMARSLRNHVCNPPADIMRDLCAGDMSRGPYIFSYAQPASRLEPVPPPFLFLDLSDVHPAAFAEFVSAFRAQVKRDDISDGARINSLRLKLLNIVLTASDWVTPVQKAVADIVRAPGSGNSGGK